MQLFKQSTAVTISIGPCLDADGAEYTGLVIGDLTLTKNGTSAAMASAATLTATSNGHYDLVTTTGNIDTLGRLRIRCNKSTYQIPVIEGMVVPAMVYDSLVLGTDVLQADVTQWLGTAPATPTVAGVPEVDVTHVSGSAEDIATETKQNTAQADLDILTGTNGVTLATSQPNYAPATSAQATAIEADTQDLQTQIGTAGAGLTGIPKTGYKLASDGLDVIDATIPSAVATTFPGFIKQLWSRFFYKSTLSSTELITYASDGTTVVTTQTVSDTGTLQTQGKAS